MWKLPVRIMNSVTATIALISICFFMNCKEKQVYKNKTHIKYKLSSCKLISYPQDTIALALYICKKKMFVSYFLRFIYLFLFVYHSFAWLRGRSLRYNTISITAPGDKKCVCTNLSVPKYHPSNTHDVSSLRRGWGNFLSRKQTCSLDEWAR